MTNKLVDSFVEVPTNLSFRTRYVPLRIRSRSGSRMQPIYSASFDEKGVLQLEQVGEKDVYADIQSYKEMTEINTLIDRYRRGETDVLERAQGFYADISEIPNDHQKVLNSVSASEQFFASLPVDVKQRFNNSASQFYVALEDPSVFASVFNRPVEPVSPVEPVAPVDPVAPVTGGDSIE